jgi:hypothetical protein
MPITLGCNLFFLLFPISQYPPPPARNLPTTGAPSHAHAHPLSSQAKNGGLAGQLCASVAKPVIEVANSRYDACATTD